MTGSVQIVLVDIEIYENLILRVAIFKFPCLVVTRCADVYAKYVIYVGTRVLAAYMHTLFIMYLETNILPSLRQ
jgi:hypothetical protein